MKFNEAYKIYLDVTVQSDWEWNEEDNASWVEVTPDIEPIKWELEKGEYFHRFGWGKITFRNTPFQNKRLYDTISGLPVTQEIRIKLVYGVNIIRGYFGNNDCDFDDDNKVLSVIPSSLDQYTEILENQETKIDAAGGIYNYSSRYELDETLTVFTKSHKLPIKIISNNILEARTPDITKIPNLGGSFIQNTKIKYNSKFEVSIDATIYNYGVNNLFFYLRIYNIFNILLKEKRLAEYSGYGTIKISILESFYYETEIEIGSYVVLSCDMTQNVSHTIDYHNIELKQSFVSLPFNAIDVNVKMISTNLVNLPVWNEIKHGRATVKEKDWKDSDGLSVYFEPNGQPKEEYFGDSQFGTSAGAGATIFNDKDISSESIQDFKLSDLIDLLGNYKYEVSSITVYKGTKYRQWATLKRRIYAICEFSREEYLKLDEDDGNGGFVNPPGPGWERTEYKELGKNLWIRLPLGGEIPISWDLGILDTSGGKTDGFGWYEKLSSTKIYPKGEGSRLFNTARTFREFIKTLYNGSSKLLSNKEIKSTFFWNDDESELPYYNSQNSGSNYVTTDNPNVLNNIVCLHTENLNLEINSSATEKSKLEISFKDLMSDIRKLFPVYWFVEENGTLHIEHNSYFDLKIKEVDVSTNPLIDETLKFQYNKELMFDSIGYDMVNGGYLDFTNNIVTFNKIASNKRSKDLILENKTEYISTDIKYCIENQSNLENGIVLLATENGNVINSVVPIANSVFENGVLAISNLLLKYWTYEGVWKSGYINGILSEFKRTYRTKEGASISLKGIYYKDGHGNIINFLQTNLGIGLINSLKIDFDRMITEDILLTYRYDALQGSDSFVLVTKSNSYLDFGNYEN